MNKWFVFGELYDSSYLLYLSWTGMHFGDTWNKCPTLSLYHFHHVWCACRSQEELTDSNVSCRVTSRPKHFLISLQISFVIGLLHLLLYFLYCHHLESVYIYIYSSLSSCHETSRRFLRYGKLLPSNLSWIPIGSRQSMTGQLSRSMQTWRAREAV